MAYIYIWRWVTESSAISQIETVIIGEYNQGNDLLKLNFYQICCSLFLLTKIADVRVSSQ